MHLPRIGLTTLLTVLVTLTISNFLLISNPNSPFRNSQVLAQTPDERKAEADQLFGQGIEQYQISQFEAALQSFQQALTIYQEIQDRQGEAAALLYLGIAYDSQGDHVKAIAYYQQSLIIARELEHRRGEAGVLSNLGIAYRDLGDYAKAIEYQQQSLAIAQGIQDRQSEGAALTNLGIAYDSLGDHGKAIAYYQQSLTIAQELKNRRGEAAVLANLGIAYDSLGDRAKAIAYYQQVLTIARELNDYQTEASILGNLGVVYYSLGDYAKGIEYNEQALALAKSIGNRPGEGQALGNLGAAYNALADYAKAIEYHKQALALARELKNRQGEGKALGNLANAYTSLGEHAKAIEYNEQSLALAREIKDRQTEGLTLNNLGVTILKFGNLPQAEKILFSAIEIWESLRADLGSDDTNKVSIFEEQARTYRTLQQVLIAQNKTDAALEIAERGRARAFVDLLTRRLSSNPTEQSSIRVPTIEQIKQIAKTQNSTLVQYSIIYDYFNVGGQQKIHESELYSWVIKPTGEVTFRKADLKPLWQQQNTSLAELVTNSRESIGVRSRGIIVVSRVDNTSQAKQLQQLHQLLIQPIADLLPTDPNQRVIFIPQDSLFLVPFPALQDESGKYLIEKHTILTAPSIQVLELTRKQRERLEAQPLQTNDALVVGNPIMPSVPPYPGEAPQQLPSLPGAQKEALAIAPLLNTKALIGKDATKIAVEQLMPKARIIHLATHGLLDDVRGLGSALALTSSSSDDGLLTAEKILELQLNAELVVLSACDTGRGRITGDGVIGLSRSLISAGVPSVIVSLWSVPDAPTASLMTEFYQNLQNNPGKAQALRQAMLTTMKQHPNPRDWASFTLIGEAQ